MTFKEHLLFLIDGLISVHDYRFRLDFIRYLGWLPGLPFLLAAAFFLDVDALWAGLCAVAAAIVLIPWWILLVKRQAKKKAEWEDPARFTDRNDLGY
jgi:hypothetical protein